MSVVSDDIYVKDDEYDLTTSPGVVGWHNSHERVANPNLSDENIVSPAYEPIFEHQTSGGSRRCIGDDDDADYPRCR